MLLKWRKRVSTATSLAFKMQKAGRPAKGALWMLLFASLIFSVEPSFSQGDFEDIKDSVSIPIGGNTWVIGNGSGRVTNQGISGWRKDTRQFESYVRLGRTGDLNVAIEASGGHPKDLIGITINGKKKQVALTKKGKFTYPAGTWYDLDTGYLKITFEGITKTGGSFPALHRIILTGSAVNPDIRFVKNNEGNFFYWGRRGPSTHLNYILPEEEEIEWFYNEVTVPEGDDVLGSYFMADGFSGGYFGMQVNAPDTRHILFSVWSPYHTDDPREIPDSLQIKLLKKGKDVHAGEFGNEGSGGQSYLNYMWKAGNTYSFLLKAEPKEGNRTVYTAYFYAPEKKKWFLIASFSRPMTSSYLTGLYSFLENFSPEQGDKRRKVLFGNQWVRTTAGKWIELNEIKFTADNTGRKGYRMDYSGGVSGEGFYLENFGFFEAYTPIGSSFERPEKGIPPKLNLKKIQKQAE